MIVSRGDSELLCGRTALALAAHGATADARCAASVLRHADAIRRMRIFDDVVCVFWIQAPYFRELFDLTNAPEITVVPVMTADGYYARHVLPREIDVEARRDRHIRITPAIGTNAVIDDLIIAQAVDAAHVHEFELKDAHLLIVGHGTRRDPQRSGASTLDSAARIGQRGIALSVHAAFLEQDPLIPDALAATPGEEPIIIVPNLIANGGHAVEDIPKLLGLPTGARTLLCAGRRIFFADAVGERKEIVDLILQAAQAARKPAPLSVAATPASLVSVL